MIPSQRSIVRAAIALAGLFICAGDALAQSGRGAMHGYIVFNDISYNDLPASGVVATIEMKSVTSGDEGHFTAQSDEHGLFKLDGVRMGEYKLTIKAAGYRTYTTQLYIPSDFVGNLSVVLRRARRAR